MARYALVIGIAAYNNFGNLEKAVTDAEAIAQLLEQRGNFQEVKRLPAKWLKDERRWVVAADKKLTGKELGNELRIFLLEQAAKQEAVIYFAGHGFPASSCMGVEEGYLATSDCSEDGRNAIPLRHFNALMAESDLSSLVVMLDCCYAGTLLERQLLEPTFTAFNTKRDYYLITACRGFQKAYEGVEHGVFTQAILKGLAAENADEKGQVSGDRLFDYIASELKGSRQEPIRMGWGRSIALVKYQPKKTEVVIDETCPYQGLEAFSKEQARFFFGREKVVQLLMERLGQANFVPIIGASGSGKSSVVRAGLIPELEKNGWRILKPILPGDEPLAELKTVLIELFGRTEGREVYSLVKTDGLRPALERLPGSEKLLLVVDQFEEVFTVCPKEKEEERCQFIELLTQVAEIPDSRLAVVTTMRADFLEPCLQYESLTQLIQNQVIYMPPLMGGDLEKAIAKPAELQGYRLEDGLLGTILNDVKGAGSLPLLQFALTELWEKRDRENHLLTLEQYEVMEGAIGSLNRHAQKVYTYKDFLEDSPTEERGKQEQEWIKRIVLKLVRTGQDEKDTRQRQPKGKLLAIAGDNPEKREALNKVIDKLVQGRLLVTGEAEQKPDIADSVEDAKMIDLAHEALMEGWKRFAEWRKEDRQLRRLIDRIEDALREWEKQPKDENLMMGGLLAQVRQEWQNLEPYLEPTLQDFYQRSDAHEQDRIAELQKALTESILREQSARVLNLLPVQPLDALVLAIQTMGLNLDQLPEDALSSVDNLAKYPGKILGSVQASLRQAMETVRVPKTLGEHEDSVRSVAFSPDGKWIVSGSDDKTVRLWNIQGNAIAEPFQGHENSVRSVAFSPDGKWIVSGSEDNTVRLWDIQGNPIGQPFMGHEDGVSSVAFSPDGQMIVSGSDDKTVRLWDIQGKPISEIFLGHESYVTSVAFSSDGRWIVSGSDDSTLRLWNTKGKEIGEPFRQLYDVTSVAFSSDGKLIVSGNGRTLQLWNTKGKEIGEPFEHYDSVNAVAFSPNSKLIVSGCSDKTLNLWDTEANLIGQPFRGHEDYVNSVAFSPDGKQIVSGSDDKTVRLWDTENNPISEPLEHKEAVYSVAFSPDGKLIVSGGDKVKTLLLWDTEGNFIGKPLWENEGYGNAVAFSPDGKQIVSSSYDKRKRLWNIERNLISQIWSGHKGYYVNAVAFSPDGKLVVSCSNDQTVRLWDIQGNPIGEPFRGHKDTVFGVAFSPDGQMIVSCSGNFNGLQDDNTVRLWDLQGNLIGQSFRGHEASVNAVAFSPDGQMIVSCSGSNYFITDNTVRLWDLQGNPIGEPFQGHEELVISVAISPDSKLIVSGSWDRTVRLWRGGWREWLEVCCNRLRYHPVFQNPQTEVEKQACETCQKYFWGKE